MTFRWRIAIDTPKLLSDLRKETGLYEVTDLGWFHFRLATLISDGGPERIQVTEHTRVTGLTPLGTLYTYYDYTRLEKVTRRDESGTLAPDAE
ncbi:hypothetical protein QR680_011877 [Steinernema hermaphroditum]|uniref:Uncharacterized protein n=1 Tax=Steinernema hermaphroditum TaxID=289476 RepID=A0AA39I015_9BILA|nr:hypothetical protein QR680_011877 [Steinernema hermaphroditum]